MPSRLSTFMVDTYTLVECGRFIYKTYREVKSKPNDKKVRGRCQQYLVKILRSVEIPRRS
jgi:hypothetical protein